MVETGGLENRCTRKGTGGSNPSLSAILTQIDRRSYNQRLMEVALQWLAHVTNMHRLL